MKRQRILRMIVVALGLLAAGLAGACIYQYAASATAARAIAGQQDALEQMKGYAAELARAQAEGRQMSEQVLQHKAPWTWSEQLPVMVAQISGIVEQDGVKIDTLQPAPPVEREHLTRFPLRLTLRTDLEHLKDLMVRLRQAVPLLAVDHFAIRSGQKQGEPLQVEMTLSSYVIIDGQATGGRQ